MSEKEIDLLEVLRQNNSIEFSTIVSLINYGFDSNDSLIALDFGLDFPQMSDISSEQKSVLKRVLTEYGLDLSLDFDLNTFMESIEKSKQMSGSSSEEEYYAEPEDSDEEVNPYLRKYYENELKSRELRENELKNEIKVLNKKLESIEKSFKRLLNGNRNELKELKNSLINAKNERIVENIGIKDKSFVENNSLTEEVVKHSTESDVRVENRKSEDMNRFKDVVEVKTEVMEESDICCDFEEDLSEEIHELNEIKIVSNDETIKELVRKPNIRFGTSFGVCGQSSKVMVKTEKQIKSHLNTKQFKCNYNECDYCFSSFSELRRHTLLVHEKRFCFKCTECDKRFQNKPLFDEHMNKHFISKSFVSNDKILEKLPKEKNYIESDVHWIENLMQMELKVEVLGGSDANGDVAEILKDIDDREESLSEDKLKIKRVLNEEKVNKYIIRTINGYDCGFDFCGKSYKHFNYIERHIKRHLGFKLIKCNASEVVSAKNHLNISNDEKDILLSCKGLASMKKVNKYYESKAINGKKVFYCKWFGCEFKTFVSTKIANHINLSHIGIEFRCNKPNCHKVFRNPNSYREHQKNHICGFGTFGYGSKGVVGVCRNESLNQYRCRVMIDSKKYFGCKWNGTDGVCKFLTQYHIGIKRHIHNHVCPYRVNLKQNLNCITDIKAETWNLSSGLAKMPVLSSIASTSGTRSLESNTEDNNNATGALSNQTYQCPRIKSKPRYANNTNLVKQENSSKISKNVSNSNNLVERKAPEQLTPTIGFENLTENSDNSNEEYPKMLLYFRAPKWRK